MALKTTIDIKINPRAVREIQDKVFGVIREGTILVLRETKIGSPVKFGFNRRSITSEVVEDKNTILARVFGTSKYSGWLEIGTARMAARPYFFPALQKGIDWIRKNLRGAI